jgi:hypothetical protein
MLALFLVTALADAAAPPAAIPSVTAYYIAALHATRSSRQPDSATYHTSISSTGMKFDVTPYKGEAALAVGYGSGMHSSQQFDSSYTRSNDRIVATIEQKPTLVRIPMFNPTWSGIAGWMKYGFYGPAGDSAPTTASTAAPQTPSPSPSPATAEPRTIASVTAIDPGGYSITDGGSAPCEGGTPGHKLLLRALRDPEAHPLTSVVIAPASMRFCTMDFRLGASSALSFAGTFALHLGDVGGNWLVTDGTADFFIRMLGISASHTRISFGYSNFAFPEAY